MKISCPHCGQSYDIDRTKIGTIADCTNCGHRFVIYRPAETENNLKVRSNRWSVVGIWAIFFLLFVFGIAFAVWQINVANAEKERRAEEERIELEITHERNIEKCVTFLRELAVDCTCRPEIKKYPTFPALQKKAREDISYLETFSKDFEKYLKDRNKQNMLPWWKEKIFGDDK